MHMVDIDMVDMDMDMDMDMDNGHGGPMQRNITQPLPLLDTMDNWTWI